MLRQKGINIHACSQETTPQSKARFAHFAAFFSLSLDLELFATILVACAIYAEHGSHSLAPSFSEFLPSYYVIRNRVEESLSLTLRL